MPKDRKSHKRRHRDRDAPYEKDGGGGSSSSSRHHNKQKRRHENNQDEFGRKSRGSSAGNSESIDDTTPCPTFDSMALKPALLRGIYAYGFEKPSAIQQRAIRPIVRGRDVIAQSQSGTGKTAVFSISALQLLDDRVKDPQVLILSPTRELAEQTTQVVSSLGDFMSAKCHGCIGGRSLGGIPFSQA